MPDIAEIFHLYDSYLQIELNLLIAIQLILSKYAHFDMQLILVIKLSSMNNLKFYQSPNL